MIGHDAAQVLKIFIFILNRALDPVFRVLIDHDTTLVKTGMTIGKVCLDCKGKILFLRVHQEQGRIVIDKVVIGLLPQIGMGLGGDSDFLV